MLYFADTNKQDSNGNVDVLLQLKSPLELSLDTIRLRDTDELSCLRMPSTSASRTNMNAAGHKPRAWKLQMYWR